MYLFVLDWIIYKYNRKMEKLFPMLVFSIALNK